MTVSLKVVAAALGGVVDGGKVRFPAPGHSAKDRSATLWLNGTDLDGFRVDCFTEDWRVVRDYVRGRLDLSELRPEEQRRAKVEPQSALASYDALARYKLERAEAIWQESRPPKGTPVETYIETARGISLPDDVLAADAIRFNPQCPFKLENGTMVKLPAMVAAMRCIHTDKFTGVHRTALRADGSGKADMPGLGDPKRCSALPRVRSSSFPTTRRSSSGSASARASKTVWQLSVPNGGPYGPAAQPEPSKFFRCCPASRR